MDETTAITRARQLLGKLQVESFPVNVSEIASAEGFEVQESDKLDVATSGQVWDLGVRKIIVVNKHDHPYRRRFTILHEVAHHYLGLPSHHGDNLPASELGRYRGRPREELLCDVFAAECLVPWKLIQHFSESMEFSATTIAHLSDMFEASKPCVASRFAQASPALVAYVPAEEGVIRNAIMSKALREERVWISVGVKLPLQSAAAALLSTGGDTRVAELDGSDWSSTDVADAFVCQEEALRAPDWNQTLSLLTFEKVGKSASIPLAHDESDELLPELTGHLPWPKK